MKRLEQSSDSSIQQKKRKTSSPTTTTQQHHAPALNIILPYEANDIQSIISRIWQPLEYPPIVEQLQERIKDLYVVCMNGNWILLYVAQFEEKIELWRGKFCNPQTFGMQVKSDYQGEWTLPHSLSKFYCVHDGFSRMVDQFNFDSFKYCSIASSSELEGFAIDKEKVYLLLKIFSDSCGQGASYCKCLDPNVSLPNDQVFDHYGQLPIASDFQPFVYYLDGGPPVYKTNKLEGFVRRCKDAHPEYHIQYVKIDRGGALEIYIIPEGQMNEIPSWMRDTVHSSSSSSYKAMDKYKAYEGYLFEFYASGESQSEKKTRMKMDSIMNAATLTVVSSEIEKK
ncbi:predicted protein [Naegleria gruberi]|uniref:Predicted protein n=1 Tax=Naegleria gruberi TaxID=5762 RepID=D2W0F5_NAEGR|nr:uncharacterized protein NAEGRDRAFT_74839 [Naegleria gruberi]EFC37466.1 predicted protein [Naegleria gruberi]|eukprot:XP_002670210.1 predicted protein [Naegleria gruberi strain NEG-M]